MAEEEQGQQDAAEVERVREFIKAQVIDTMKSMETERSPSPVVPTTTEEEQGRQRLKEVIDPIYRGDIDHVKFVSADAKDEIRFYRKNPDAVDYEEKIETLFTDLAKAGRPTSREHLYHLIIGQEAHKDPEKFVERHAEKKKRQVESAREGLDFGASGLQRTRNDNPFENFESKTIPEMEKALEGVIW